MMGFWDTTPGSDGQDQRSEAERRAEARAAVKGAEDELAGGGGGGGGEDGDDEYAELEARMRKQQVRSGTTSWFTNRARPCAGYT